jgi:CubicO group peptidase (beta-lactamase class C family)
MYPTPTDVLTKSTPVPKAIDSLQHTLDSAISNGTLTGANTSFHIAVFSTDDTLFDFSYISPGSVDDLSSGDLDKNTLFRIGSIGKLLTVYSLLATTGVEHLNDPVTKWVPELAEAYYESQVDTAKWQDISIGALASHLAGVRDCT